MSRTALLIALSLLACDQPELGDEELHCEIRTTVYAYQDPIVDVLLVIDDSAAMAGYGAALDTNLGRWINVLEYIEGGLPSLHLGVISADVESRGAAFESAAQVTGCQPPDDAFLLHHSDPWWMCGSDPGAPCGARNFTGELADAARCVGLLDATGPISQQPLRAAVQALDGSVPGNDGFLRDDALLMVVVVTANDDASVGGVAEYAAALRGLKRDPNMVLVAVVAPTSATRVAAFAEQFPQRGTLTSIDDEDWSEAFIIVANIHARLLASSCVERADPTDIDLNEPGVQLDCIATQTDQSTQEESVVQPCRMTADRQPAANTPLPCYWFDTAPDWCPHLPRLEGVDYRNSYEIRCVGTCE